MARQAAFAESNIANLGSELEHQVRQAAAHCEASWKMAGRVPGIEIWRIEQFRVVGLEPKFHGLFYSGDSYIVLHTYKDSPTTLAWDAHFWLGKDTSMDEAGTAAYKTVELDDHLGGKPIEYREVEGNESDLFLSYFPNGIRYLEGGTQTGFSHVTAVAWKPRLIHIKGRMNAVRFFEVPLQASSVNSGDVFILDLGMKLIQFNGKASGPAERAKAGSVCRCIDGERDGRPTVEVFDEPDTIYPAEWRTHLGSGPYKSAVEGGDDDALRSRQKALFRITDASGVLQVHKEATGALSFSMLDQNDVFIIDSGKGVFAWVGKNSSAGEKSRALRFAQEYVKMAALPPNTSVSRVLAGSESEYFKKTCFSC